MKTLVATADMPEMGPKRLEGPGNRLVTFILPETDIAALMGLVVMDSVRVVGESPQGDKIQGATLEDEIRGAVAGYIALRRSEPDFQEQVEAARNRTK
jgi:hypothetical protein